MLSPRRNTETSSRGCKVSANLVPKASNVCSLSTLGWITWFGWISLLAGVANVTAVQIQGIAIFNNDSYTPQRWHITMIIAALLFVQGAMNAYTFWLVPYIELLGGVLHVSLWIIIIVVLLVRAPKHNPDFVFFTKSSSSGWTNKFVIWNLGLLTPTWGFVGMDSYMTILMS